MLSAYRLYEWMVLNSWCTREELDLGPVGSASVETEEQVPLARRIAQNAAILARYQT